MHAGSVSETQVLDNVINYLQGQGYSLKTITEIIQSVRKGGNRVETCSLCHPRTLALIVAR